MIIHSEDLLEGRLRISAYRLCSAAKSLEAMNYGSGEVSVWLDSESGDLVLKSETRDGSAVIRLARRKS